MIELIEPNEKYLQSYIEAYNEYIDNNVTTYAFKDAKSRDIFSIMDDFRNERNLRPGLVGESTYWLVDSENTRFIGEISIRHRLTEKLLQRGGHISCGVRYSEWGHGYGTQMLAMALEKAKELGVSPVLITCNDDNIASARVIEKNGFVLRDKVEAVAFIEGKNTLTRRYWKTIL